MKTHLNRFIGWIISTGSIREQKGATFTELSVVLAIGGALVTALGFSFDGWKRCYQIESTTKEIYSDLMDARVRALQKNRTHFVSLSQTGYTVYEDSHLAPDGNNALDTAEDRVVTQKELDKGYPMTWSNIRDKKITFNARGLSNDWKTICIFSKSEPDYDCIEVSATRINIGKLMKQPDQGGRCIAENCESR